MRTRLGFIVIPSSKVEFACEFSLEAALLDSDGGAEGRGRVLVAGGLGEDIRDLVGLRLRLPGTDRPKLSCVRAW